jgi:hypothetical protein
MLIMGDDYGYIAFVKVHLSEQFHLSNLGPLSYFLGIDRVGLTGYRSVDTSMEFHTHLRATDNVPLEELTRYRHLVGSLVYLDITRPDISYVFHILSQFMSTPTSVHYTTISFTSFDIFVALLIDVCSSLIPAHFSSMLTLMLLGALIRQT